MQTLGFVSAVLSAYSACSSLQSAKGALCTRNEVLLTALASIAAMVAAFPYIH